MMPTFWFCAVAFMASAWAVLDGFDLGAGILQRFVAKTPKERAQVLAAIGPYWDGNEVWLIALGGTVLLAFPPVLTAALSGFYVPIMVFLWVLMLRGLSIELRHHHESPLWHDFWDTAFQLGSLLTPLLAVVALANVLRGVPLDAQGSFSVSLFEFGGEGVGALDAVTLPTGLFGVSVCMLHGARFLRWKTDGEVEQRSRRALPGLSVSTGVLWLFSTVQWLRLTVTLQRFTERPALLLGVAVAIGLFVVGAVLDRRGSARRAFVTSALFIVVLLATALGSQFPRLLPALGDDGFSLTIANSFAPGDGPLWAVRWWLPGLALSVGYFVYILKTYRGKTTVDGSDHH